MQSRSSVNVDAADADADARDAAVDVGDATDAPDAADDADAAGERAFALDVDEDPRDIDVDAGDAADDEGANGSVERGVTRVCTLMRFAPAAATGGSDAARALSEVLLLAARG